MRACPQAPGVRSWVYLFWGDISFEGNSVGRWGREVVAQMPEGKEMSQKRALVGRVCQGWGHLDDPPREECDAAFWAHPRVPPGVLSHLLLAATIQMIMTLELCASFIFSLLAGWAGVKSEPRAETVEDAEVWKVLSSDPWYKGHCTHWLTGESRVTLFCRYLGNILVWACIRPTVPRKKKNKPKQANKTTPKGLPWWPSGKSLPCNAEGMGLIPGQGTKIPRSSGPWNLSCNERSCIT